MKYNQQQHKEETEQRLLSVLSILDIDSSQLNSATFRDVRLKLNELYPSTTVPVVNNIEYDSTKALIRDRKRIFNAARYSIYGLSTIKNRENNV
jgi:hypothetical protein